MLITVSSVVTYTTNQIAKGNPFTALKVLVFELYQADQRAGHQEHDQAHRTAGRGR